MPRAALISLASLAVTCSQPSPVPEAAGPTITERARALRASAERHEPSITRRLRALATAQRGALVKLEHRFKSVDSIERKLRLRIIEDPGHEPEEDDVIDALRYTMVIADEPAGHHAAAIAAVLAALESDGQTVVRVKNYWPVGDNYSGVNVVLRVARELYWEVQFHTTRSAEVRDKWHKSYRILRAPGTSLAERRKIFDAMASPWESVPVPAGILAGAGTLHPTEKVILYPRP